MLWYVTLVQLDECFALQLSALMKFAVHVLCHHHRLLRHTGSTQQQLYTIRTYSEIIKHKKIKMIKSEHYSTIHVRSVCKLGDNGHGELQLSSC